MRYAIGIFLLASPAFSAEPVYSWQSRADDPARAYLYLDGKQIGGWDYRAKHYRAFDGTSWGTPTDSAPVSPPARRVVVSPSPKAPTMAQPIPPLPPLRGPLRKRAANAMTEAIVEGTMTVVEQIPQAILDSLKRGDFQLKFDHSVTHSESQPAAVPPTPPAASPPARTLQRRWLIPRR